MKLRGQVMTWAFTILIGLGCIARAGEKAEPGKALKAAIEGSDKLDAKAKTFAVQHLLPLCTNPVFVKAVTAQNAEKVSLEAIKKIDEEWKNAEEPLAIQEEKLGNACAKEIAKVAKETHAILEAFVMDNQGAVVGANNLTSDYWQGDEAKWQNSYNEGKGGLDAGEAGFDRSANAVIQQISLPVIDADGTVIGAVTYGVATDKL